MPLFDVTVHDKSGALVHRVAHQVRAEDDRKAVNDVVLAYRFTRAWVLRAVEAAPRAWDVTMPTLVLSQKRR
jgi:hypothetical protein